MKNGLKRLGVCGHQWRRRDSNSGIGAAAVSGQKPLRREQRLRDSNGRLGNGGAGGRASAASGEQRPHFERRRRGGDDRGGTEWRGPAHVIAQVTGVRRSDGRNSDARATVTPMDCLRVDVHPSKEMQEGKGKNKEKKR
jgi:hypothetical protein